MRTERMLFHLPRGGSLNRGYGGVLINPAILAFSGTDDDNPDGLYAVHSALLDAEELLCNVLGIEFIPDGYAGSKKGSGQWVYEVTYDEADVPKYDNGAGEAENARHLRGGSIRRMTTKEAKRLAAEGCPWEGGTGA